MKMKIVNNYFFVVVLSVFFMACGDDNPATPETKVHLKFIPTYNGEPLSIDSVYTNSFGQQL